MIQNDPVSKSNLPIPFLVTEWFRSSYKLEKRGHIYYINSEEGSKVEKYSPNVDPLEKQPQYPKEWKTMPHIHLARLDIRKPEEVLDFVNRWGLLGLWRVKGYSEWPWPRYKDPEEKPLYYDRHFKVVFSEHYLKHGDLNNGKNYYLCFQEPLPAFIDAAKEFQFMSNLLNGNADDKSEAEEIISKYIKDIRPVVWYLTEPKEQWSTHWDSPSLLHTCYLHIWMDLMALRKYRKCNHERCNSFFVVSRSDEEYCSYRCKNNAMRKKYYEDIEKPKKSKGIINKGAKKEVK